MDDRFGPIDSSALASRNGEENLDAGEQEYRMLIAEMLSGYVLCEAVVDEENRPIDLLVLKINPAGERILKVRVPDGRGVSARKVFPGLEDFWIQTLGEVALTRKPVFFEHFGSVVGRYLEVRAMSPSPGKFAAIFNDITERRHAEIALKESEARLRLLFEQTPVMLWTTDTTLTITSANGRSGKFIETDSKSIVGQSLYNTIFDHEEDTSLVIQAHERALRGESSDYYLKHGEQVFECYVEPLRDEAQAIIGVISAGHDVTEREHAQERLRASLSEKEILLQEVHHRVKNNLQTIIGILQLEADRREDPRFKESLHDIEGRIRAIAAVHERLYRKENLSGEIELRELIDEVCKNAIHLAKHPIDIRMDIPAAAFDMDLAVPCGLAINELVSNAVKHAFPDGAPHGKACAIEIVAALRDGMAEIRISDNGIGFAREAQDGARRSLGLYLVNLLCSHQLQGKLQFETGPGTTAVISLPLPK